MKKMLFSLLAAGLLWSCNGGPAATTEPTAHPEWTYNTVVYELNVRQLTPESSFARAEAYLPALKELGVDIVWVMPPYPIGVKERKGTLGSYYAISDYCAINPEFGTMADFESFLAKAHELGLRVILDWVANHTSPDAKWAAEHADWHVRDSLGQMVVQYDWTDIAKLDYSNREMRAAMTDAMRFWLAKGVDGFRCDVAGEIPTDFWREAFAALKADYPDIYLLAEAEKPELHTDAFDATYAWDFHHLINQIAQGEKGVADLKAYIAHDAEVTPHEAFRLMFTSNHDENSWNGTEFERMGDAVRCFAALTFVLPNGQPLIYTGQEFGYDHRFEFFEHDPMPSLEPNEWTEFYRDLCAMRHAHPALASGERGGEIVYLADVPENVLAFTRTVGDDSVLCLFNLSTAPVTVEVPERQIVSELEPWGYLIAGKEGCLVHEGRVNAAE